MTAFLGGIQKAGHMETGEGWLWGAAGEGKSARGWVGESAQGTRMQDEWADIYCPAERLESVMLSCPLGICERVDTRWSEHTRAHTHAHLVVT